MEKLEVEDRIELLRYYMNGDRIQMRLADLTCIDEWSDCTHEMHPEEFFNETYIYRVKSQPAPYSIGTAYQMMNKTVHNKVLEQNYRIVGYVESGFIIELVRPHYENLYQHYGYQNALKHLVYKGKPVGVVN